MTPTTTASDTKLSTFAAALTGLVLCYAACSKILDIEVFRQQLLRQPFPDAFANILFWLLPLIELLTCFLLLRRSLRVVGLIASALLMLAFTIYIVLGINGMLGEIPCTCAGLFGDRLDWRSHLVVNVVILLIAIAGIIPYLKKGGSRQQK